MESPAVISPSSDKLLWSTLQSRIETILDNRKPIDWSSATCAIESASTQGFRNDSVLLIKGLDSVAASLSQLTDTLTAAQRGLSDLHQPTKSKLTKRESFEEDEESQPKSKKLCSSTEVQNEPATKESSKAPDSSNVSNDNGAAESGDKEDSSSRAIKSESVHKAKDRAICVVTKAASLATELKAMKKEVSFMHERCTLLEEENKRLRDGFEKGVAPDEDDLVRLQLEALLAEKSRLANENATLTRENECLRQLVEYHQLRFQDLSPSYDEVIQGVCLDFSSPSGKSEDVDDTNGLFHAEIPYSSSAFSIDDEK